MRRLSGEDAFFLYSETPSLHMHTLKLAVVDAPPRCGEDLFPVYRRFVAERLHLLPPLRRRVVPVPLSFHHPVWVEDADFRLENHLHRATVPAPGGTRELDAVVGRLAALPVDRRRPLWELWMLDGLRDGQIAFLTKIHHAAADGVAANRMLAAVTGVAETAVPASSASWEPEAVPAPARMLVQAFSEHLRQLVRLPPLFVRTIRALRRTRRHARQSGMPLPWAMHVPRTSFNCPLSPARSFATTSVSLDEVRAVRSDAQCTVNDVVLAVCAGVLRDYLAARDELPREPLTAAVPVSTDPPGDTSRLAGNRVSNLYPCLCTDIADPRERLRAIRRWTREAKAVHALLGANLYHDWIDYTPPAPYRSMMRLYSRWRVAAWMRPPVNVIISNVPGPSEVLYVNGARLAAFYSVGPILEGVGLNLTVWSYAGRMHFGVLTCPEAVPDVGEIRKRIAPALAELRRAVSPPASRTGRSSVP